MLDVNWICNNSEQASDLFKKRGLNTELVVQICSLNCDRKRLQTHLQGLQEQRNAVARVNSAQSREAARALRDEISAQEEKVSDLNSKLGAILCSLPNLPAPDVPEGASELDNLVLSSWNGTNAKESGMHHLDILEKLGMIELEQTVKMSGSRFVTLKGDIARLSRALVTFMIDVHTSLGFLEVAPPYLVSHKAMYNSGQLPKFDQESFSTSSDHRLIPTAEVPLVNLLADSNLEANLLPIRMVAATPCFRSEAGSAGKDTRGIIRLHQFNKVELVSIALPDKSEQEHEFLLKASSSILERLSLPYRTVLLCSQDMGFAAQKTYDLEVWMPGDGKYREISSCSNCGSFQARRMNAKFKVHGGGREYLHTLNSSGLAIERTLAAILENYFDGEALDVPEPLRPYLGGQSVIR